MYKLIKCFLAIGFVIIIATANADTSKTEIKKINKITENKNQTDTGEITVSQAYKLLYENSKESNDRIISTTHWVLAFVFTFLLALIGSQVFFNFRISKKEIDNIKKDIDKKTFVLKEALLKDINETNRESTKQFQEFKDKIRPSLKEEINHRFDEKSTLLDVKVKVFEKDIKILKQEINNNIKDLKVVVTKNKGDLWNLKGVKSNALTQFINTATLVIELKKNVKYILNDIIEILTELKEIHEFDYSDLKVLITKIPQEHSKMKSEIEKLYKDKPVYKFIYDPETGSDRIQFVKNMVVKS